jgi:hypothetical protein
LLASADRASYFLRDLGEVISGVLQYLREFRQTDCVGLGQPVKHGAADHGNLLDVFD